MRRKRRRFANWRARLADRLAQSSHVFLFGLVIACGVEVLVDWNQTLSEINILRDQVRQKGLNYAGILERAVVEPVLSGDHAVLDRLATGLLDDEDAVYVRVVDRSGKVVYDSIDPSFEQAYAKRGKGLFRQHYAHWLERDLHGVVFDPEGFKQRLASSRYRDVPQMYHDLMGQLLSRVMTPPTLRAQIIYQDRLRDENHHRDDSVTWAIAPLSQVTPLGSRSVGAVLIAFDMTRINGAARTKYLKGIGMIVFFVALILVQNISGRRDKLRLLDVGRRYDAAKRALADEMRTEPLDAVSAGGHLVVQGTVDQARESVDGMIWDAAERDGSVEVLIADPDGDGIDAAAIGLHILRTFRKRPEVESGDAGDEGRPAASTLDEEAIRLGAATHDIPLTRPIGLLLLRIAPIGSFEAILGDATSLRIVDRPTEEQPTREPLGDGIPEGMIGPLFRSRGQLPIGGLLLCVTAGKDQRSDSVSDAGMLAKFLRRQQCAQGELPHPEDVAAWLRSRYPAQVDSDIAVVVIRRTS